SPSFFSCVSWFLSSSYLCVSVVNSEPVFAVIPTVLVGGPLAILAMLFPAVFGGLTGQLKRWLALLTVISLNSLLYLLYDWEWSCRWLKGTWWGSPLALWVFMTLLTLAGTLWAWRRHLRAVQADQPLAERPGRGEHVALWIMSLLGLGM